ncbi:ATP-binding protein [Salinibacter ruber]|uniref:Uncharacterized protein YhaN n=1 Tax=Salinibacter ruber TaxID=146919 RepID=A0A9X2Q2A3_9BACT|nr:AAA family ATPase [Salinibacter ruber]MCS3659895.1 uncharacterized protein YhaN [Salinibacter ruber]MCS3709936.1 uncharacterized protein YhaN [Salinibacter ruber]MCS4170238.1 uncharacterized protein YhaN [Salinibacter ruber]
MDDSASDSSLRFERLAAHRMYGQHFNLAVEEIGPGVNVIAGPNGCGKTTLARAIEVLVWPDSHSWERPIVDGVFQLDGSQWRVNVESGRVQFQSSSGANGPPPVPPHEHRDRYHLYLHDLLSATEGAEKDLVDVILQEAQGGYDIQSAAGTLGFGGYKKGKNLTKTQNFLDAREQVEEAREKQQDLENEERSLNELKQRRDEARGAAVRRDALVQAITLRKAEKSAQEAEEKLEDFPEDMDAVQGDEAGRLSELRQKREEAVENKEEAERKIEEAESRIDENILPEEGLPEGTFETLRNAVQEWEKARNTVQQAERERSRAKEAERQEWSRLQSEDKDRVADLSLPQLDEVQSFAESRLEVKGKERALEAMKRLFGEADPDVEPDTLRRGIERLEEWLREPSSAEEERSTGALRYVGIALSGGATLLGVVLAVGGSLLGWGVVALGVVLAVLFYVLRPSDGSETRRPDLQERFERMELEGPETWSVEAVQKRLDVIVKDWTNAHLEQAKAEEWTRQKPKRDKIDGQKEELAAEKEELVERLGVDPETQGHGLLWFVKRLGAWQDAYTKVEAKDAEIEVADGHADEWRSKVREIVEAYDTEEVDDLSDGKAVLEQIRGARQDLEQAKTKRENATENRDQAEERIKELDDKIEAIFDQLGIPVGDYQAVEERCNQAEDYREVKKKAESAQQEAELEEKRLRDEDGFEEWMLSAGIDKLKREKEEANALAEKEAELSDRISRINQKIDDAKEEHDLEDGLAERESARAELEERRQNDLQSMVGQALADVVHRRTRNQDLPAVFERADELFRRITTDRYHLDLAREDGAFRVVTDDGRRLGLSQLSGGTKVQLLLSVRIAFVERQEQGTKLPLVLDETLANSDDVKAQSVIEAVRTICSEGRQVFYLTAQSDEVAKWQGLLQGTDTDLALHELSGEEATAGREFHQLGGDGALSSGRPSRPDLPDPEEVSHTDLKEVLDVPRWSPRSPVGKLPLWYLTTDTALLCRAAEKSYRTWGQLSSLAERDALSLIGLSEEENQRMEALSRAVAAWREAWLVGRGEPVGRPALEETSAVSGNFIDEVTSLAERVDGQAERIIEELRRGAVKRFRSGKIEELRAYFQEEGYLSEREPLDSTACWRRAIAEVSEAITERFISEDDVESVLDRILDRAGV